MLFNIYIGYFPWNRAKSFGEELIQFRDWGDINLCEEDIDFEKKGDSLSRIDAIWKFFLMLEHSLSSRLLLLRHLSKRFLIYKK